MEERKLDVMTSPSLTSLITRLNRDKVQKEDLVGIYPPLSVGGDYTAVFYYKS